MPSSPTERQEPTLGFQQSEPQANPYAPSRSHVKSKARSGKLLPHQKADRVNRLMARLGIAAVVGIGVDVLTPAILTGAAFPVEKAITLAVMFGLVVALFLIASAVMQYKLWGRYAGIAYGLISPLGFPLGTLIGGYILWQLMFGWDEGAAEA